MLSATLLWAPLLRIGKASLPGKSNTSKSLSLRVVNVSLSLFALLLSFLVECVDDIRSISPHIDKLLGVLSLLCIVVAVLLTHILVGKQHYTTWQVWQPFIGGWKFVTMQGLGWTFLALSLALSAVSLNPALMHGLPLQGTWVTAGTLGFLSELLMISSIQLYESPVTLTPASSLRWNDVGTINVIVSVVSLLISVSMEHFRHLPMYNEQLHLILGVTAVLCIANAVVITHLLVGKMYHGTNWRWWIPFVGGWRFLFLQAMSWAFFIAALVFGAWSLYTTALGGPWIVVGTLGFLSEIFMVVSVQTYQTQQNEVATWRGFQQLKSGLEKGRILFVTACMFNVFYAPLAVGLPVILPFLFSPVWLCSTVLCILLSVYATTSYICKPEITGRWDSKLRNSFLVNDLVKYFDGKVVKTEELESSKQYIFGFHPHGILPIASMWSHNSEAWRTNFNTPKGNTVTLVASHLFRIPFTRDFLAAAGAREVSKVAFERSLKDGKCVFIVPGGMREMRYSSSKEDKIMVCTKHKGFVKMAIQHGVDLVPVFSFGETKLMDGAFPRLQKLFWKYVGIPFPLFIGRWNLPIPRPQPIAVVVGGAIHVKKNSNPTQEEIDDVSSTYFSALRVLFEEHKAKYGHASSVLIYD